MNNTIEEAKKHCDGSCLEHGDPHYCLEKCEYREIWENHNKQNNTKENIVKNNNEFENSIDRKRLYDAVLNWAIGQDGFDGAVGGIYNAIPWDSDMQSVLEWIGAVERFDDIIPSYEVMSDMLGDCIRKNDMGGFYAKLDSITDDIVMEYGKVIDELNTMANGKMNVNETADAHIAVEKLTEEIFNSFGNNGRYEMDFGDSGNEIFLTDSNNNHFTITVTKD